MSSPSGKVVPTVSRSGYPLPVLVASVFLACGLETVATAGTADPRSTLRAIQVEAVTLHQGADRIQRLVEGARSENRLTLYTSLSAQVLSRVVGAFREDLQKAHGLRPEVVVWRASSEEVTQRSLLEARAGRYEVDVIESNAVDVEILNRERITARFWSPYFDDYPEHLKDPARYWHANRLNIFTQAYNTRLVRPHELPKDWRDLLDPRWKGRMAIEAGDWNWYATLVTRGPFGGREQALTFFDRLQAQDLQVRSGHTLLAELLAAGEMPLVLTEYNYIVQAFKADRGAPVEWFVIEPAVVLPNLVAVAANSPHPHLATLFIDFLLSPQAQAVLNQLNVAPASPKVDSVLTQGFRSVVVDIRAVIDEAQVWQRLWEQRVIAK